MAHKSDAGSSALEVPTFGGRMPSGSGDLAIETHGITPIPEDNRYGTPRRLFTVWFAPQMNMTGVFTGSLAIVFGLGFWLGLLAMVIGTVLGSLPVAYLSTWGPRTGNQFLRCVLQLVFGFGPIENAPNLRRIVILEHGEDLVEFFQRLLECGNVAGLELPRIGSGVGLPHHFENRR